MAIELKLFDSLPPEIPTELLARARLWDSLKRWEKRDLGRALRRVGLSFGEIASLVSVSKATLSEWCRTITLTSEQRDGISARTCGTRGHHRGAETNRRRRALALEAIREDALAEIPRRATCRLWIAGVMLYWGEGSKTGSVCVTNSDPRLIRIMMRWFRECLDIEGDRFTVRLHLHSGQDERLACSFWSEVTGVGVDQFGKTFWKQEGTGHRRNILYQGTAQVVVRRSGDLLNRVLSWIDGCYHPAGPLAKLASQRTLNPSIPGSSPGRPTEETER